MRTPRFAPLGLVALLALGLSVGCYTRVELRQKSTPPASRIFVQVEIDEGLVDAHAAAQAQALLDEGDKQALAGLPKPPSSESMFETLGLSLAATLKADLVRHKLGFVVLDPAAEADLRLLGRLRQDPMSGAALDWQLIEVRSGVVVQAGVATSGFLNPEQFSDQILQDLLGVDVDQYAQAGPSAPRPAGAAGGEALKPPSSGTDGRRAFAVIVGVESYREGLPAATHAEADARAFAAFAEVTLGVPPEHIRLLLGDRAGRADVASAIEEWLPRNVREPGATVYFFFSGHGAPDVETGDAYLVPYDADPAFLKTRGYALSQLYARLGALPDAQTFAFIDACFSGAGERSVLASGTRPLVPVKAVKAPGSLIAFSAASASEATGAAADAPHGLFTLHLLDGLSGRADANADADVTLDELVNHVTAQVSRAARLQNRDQTPSLTNPARLNPQSVVLVRQLSP